MMANDNGGSNKFDIVFVDDEIPTTNVFNSFFSIIYVNNTSRVYNNPLLVAEDLRANKVHAKVWLIDVMMNGLNGVELALLVREKFGKAVKIFAYSALEKEVLYSKFPKAGVFDGFYNRIVTITDVVEELIKQADALPPFEDEAASEKNLSATTVVKPLIATSVEEKVALSSLPENKDELPLVEEPVIVAKPVTLPTPPATLPPASVATTPKPVSGFAPAKKPVTISLSQPLEEKPVAPTPPAPSSADVVTPPAQIPLAAPKSPVKATQTPPPPTVAQPVVKTVATPPVRTSPDAVNQPAPTVPAKPVQPPAAPVKVVIPANNGKPLAVAPKPQPVVAKTPPPAVDKNVTTTPSIPRVAPAAVTPTTNSKTVKITLPANNGITEKPGVFRQFVKEPVRYVLPGVDFEKIKAEKVASMATGVKSQPAAAPKVIPPQPTVAKPQPVAAPKPNPIQPQPDEFKFEDTTELDWGTPATESPYRSKTVPAPAPAQTDFSDLGYQQPVMPESAFAGNPPPKKKKKKKSSGGVSKPLVIVLIVLVVIFLLIMAFYLIPEENFKSIPFLYNFLRSIPSSF